MTEDRLTTREFDARAQGPLADMRVLDLSRLVAGNMLTLQLADFGADVIKVEPPDGDPLRAWRDGERELHWKTYARNKRSVVLNLRHAAAREALLRLAGTADVLIENYRPGTLEEMGLAPDVLLAVANPELASDAGRQPNAPLPEQEQLARTLAQIYGPRNSTILTGKAAQEEAKSSAAKNSQIAVIK